MTKYGSGSNENVDVTLIQLAYRFPRIEFSTQLIFKSAVTFM